MLCYVCYAVLCCSVLCYALLCHAVLCYAMLCYAPLCSAMLCYAVRVRAANGECWSVYTVLPSS